MRSFYEYTLLIKNLRKKEIRRLMKFFDAYNMCTFNLTGTLKMKYHFNCEKIFFEISIETFKELVLHWWNGMKILRSIRESNGSELTL